MGRADIDEHLESLGEEKWLDWKGLKMGILKVVPFLKKYID
jgi:hypothetical protein